MVMNKEIRSIKTFQKGKIIRINSNSIDITFVKEEEPIRISFDTFLKFCICDDEIIDIINKKLLYQPNFDDNILS